MQQALKVWQMMIVGTNNQTSGHFSWLHMHINSYSAEFIKCNVPADELDKSILVINF